MAVSSGNGEYTAEMVMGPDPQRNSVLAEGRLFTMKIPYVSGSVWIVDPAYIVPGNPPTVTRIRDPEPWPRSANISLWGIEAALTKLEPSPVRPPQ